MKKSYILIFATLFFSFAFFSCNNDDDNQAVEPDNHPIVGKWSLVSLTGGWNPREFILGEIVWDFSPDNTMLITIQEGVEPSPSDVFTPSAFEVNYTFSVNDLNGILTLTSDDYPEHPIDIPFVIESDSLHLPVDESADGMSYHFVKLNNP